MERVGDTVNKTCLNHMVSSSPMLRAALASATSSTQGPQSRGILYLKQSILGKMVSQRNHKCLPVSCEMLTQYKDCNTPIQFLQRETNTTEGYVLPSPLLRHLSKFFIRTTFTKQTLFPVCSFNGTMSEPVSSSDQVPVRKAQSYKQS